MISVIRMCRRAILPLGIFLAVATFHFGWVGYFPEKAAAAQEECDPAADCACHSGPASADSSWVQGYINTQSYWLGMSYGLSLAFAGSAFRRYREERLRAARNVALGGVTLSGFLAVAGCYLLGCCGSPMLGVYISLFGAAFLPFAKPLTVLLTVLSLLGAWWWMNRRSCDSFAVSEEAACAHVSCRCE